MTGRTQTPRHLLARSRQMRSDMTDAEAKLWACLRAGRLVGHKFRRQMAFGDRYIADFICPAAKFVVELDGSQHADQSGYDERRTAFFVEQGYSVLRFWNNDVLRDTGNVLTTILSAVDSPLPGAGAPVPLPCRERVESLQPSPFRGEGQRAQRAGRGESANLGGDVGEGT